MNVSVPILVAAIVVWSVIALIATLFLDRLRRIVKNPGLRVQPETDSVVVDPQPTEVDQALKLRFDKILVDNQMEHLR